MDTLEKKTLQRSAACALVALAITLPLSAPTLGAAFNIGNELVYWEQLLIESAQGTLADLKRAVAEGKHSQRVAVRNDDGQKRRVYWTAAGCAGIPDIVGLSRGVAFVCHSETLGANATGSYEFKAGTTQRHVRLYRTEVKDKICSSVMDIAGAETYGPLDVAIQCGNSYYPSTPPPPPNQTTVQIVSDRDRPVTVVIGWNSCTGTHQNITKVCATAEVPAKGRTSVSYLADSRVASNAKGGYSRNEPGSGIVTWSDGTVTSKPISLQKHGTINIPHDGNSTVLR